MLITAAQFREHYPQVTGITEDTLFGTFVARVDGLIALHCGLPRTDALTYTMESANYTLYPKPRPGQARVIDLPHPLVTAITSAHIDPDWGSDIAAAYGASDAVASTDRLLDSGARELWLGTDALPYSVWSTVPRANKVVFVGGFGGGATPEMVPIVAAAVRHLWDNRRVQGDPNVADPDALLPASVRNALGAYIVWSSRVG